MLLGILAIGFGIAALGLSLDYALVRKMRKAWPLVFLSLACLSWSVYVLFTEVLL